MFISSSLVVYTTLMLCAWHSCRYLFKSTFLAQGFSHLIPINSNGNCMTKSITTHCAEHLLSTLPFAFCLRYFLAFLKWEYWSGYQNWIWVTKNPSHIDGYLLLYILTKLKCLSWYSMTSVIVFEIFFFFNLI